MRISRIIAATAVALSLSGAVVASADTFGPNHVAPRDVHTVSRAYALHIPFCRNEDGSAQERTCFWDGRVRGNGNGRSFLAVSPRLGGIDDRFLYLTR